MWGSVPETNSNHQQFQTPSFMAPDIIQAAMNHADPNTMRARARQATEILKTQLLRTGAIEPLVALYFDDHIEQVEVKIPPSWNTLTSGPHGASTTCEPW